MYRILLAFLVLMVVVCGSARAEMRLSGLDVQSTSEEDHVTITLSSQPVNYASFTLDNPDRLVIDLPKFLWTVPDNALADYRGGVIKNVRFALFDKDTSRVVFDLTQPVKASAITFAQGEAGVQLKFSMLKSRPVALSIPRATVPSSSTARSAKPYVWKQVPIPIRKPKSADTLREKPLIVIDPGHGGQDPGAIGKHRRTREKDVTLKYAKALKAALIKTGRYSVKLTREDDRFILLRERVKIARKARGKLFISLHADSAPTRSAKGLSVYTLSENASDKEAAALAAQENKADILADLDLSEESDDVANILIDLAQRDTKNQSARLADVMIKKLAKQVSLVRNTHRFAGFAVLKAPDIPSVLVEIGFLSNKSDEKNINSSRYREKVVRGIVQGIDAYFDDISG